MATTGTTHFDGTEFGSKQVAELRRSINNAAASLFKNILGTRTVYLFGDCARNAGEHTGDIELAIVNDKFYEQWLKWLPRALEDDDWDIHGSNNWAKICRVGGLLAAGGFDPEEAWSTGFPLCGSRGTLRKLDIFVLPSGWETSAALARIKSLGDAFSPGFILEEEDAIMFDRFHGTFWPSASH